MKNKMLLDAIFKVQSIVSKVLKSGKAPKYKYADLGDVLDYIRMPLHENGLLVLQETYASNGDDFLTTKIIHVESCESVEFNTRMIYEKAPKFMSVAQAYGSAMTYARRYALMSFFQLVGEDDDGKASSQPRIEPTKLDTMPPGVATLFRDKKMSKSDVVKYCEDFNYDWGKISEDIQK